MELVTKKRLTIVAGRVNRDLADEVAARLDLKCAPVQLAEFANGELHCRFVKVMPREYKRALAEQAKRKLDDMEIGIETVVVTGAAATAVAEGATVTR